MGNLSSQTVDYLQFVSSLEPPSAHALMAQAARAAAQRPAPKEPAKRCFGTHAHTHHSNITTLGSGSGAASSAGAGGGGGGGGIGGTHGGVDGGWALHEHAAFSDRAGVPAEQPVIEVPRRRKAAAAPAPDGGANPIFIDGSGGAADAGTTAGEAAAAGLAVDVGDAPAYAAGLSTVSKAAWASHQQKRGVTAASKTASAVFGADGGGGPAAGAAGAPPRSRPNPGCRTSCRRRTR